MSSEPTNLLSTDFAPLSEVKAKLSEFIRRTVAGSKRLLITTNGRPTAVLLSYRDYAALLKRLTEKETTRRERTWTIEEWKKGRAGRAKVSESIASLFDVPSLSRKGQKRYKRETVRDFEG